MKHTAESCAAAPHGRHEPVITDAAAPFVGCGWCGDEIMRKGAIWLSVDAIVATEPVVVPPITFPQASRLRMREVA